MVGSPLEDFCKSSAELSECKEVSFGAIKGMQRRWKINAGNEDIGILKDGKFVLGFKAIFNVSSEKEFLDILNKMLYSLKFTN